MTHRCLHVAVAVVSLWLTPCAAGGQGSHVAHSGEDPRAQPPAPVAPRLFVTGDRVIERERPPLPILVRPSTLAAQIGELAGRTVRVPYSRVVGVFNPRVFVVDTASRLPAVRGNRGRVLVFIDPGALRVADTMLVASTVTVSGIARTLVGMQVTGEVAWPIELKPKVIERLEIRAAVLAASVQTADGVELTAPRE